jgi:hypothetical protein
VTNRGDTLAPPRTTRPRHKATPARTGLGIRRPGPGLRRPGLPAALRKVTPAWPDRVSIPAGTGGVASGLAAASLGALATIMIANSGHAAVQPRLTVPASQLAAVRPSRHMPRPVYRPRIVAHRKRHHHRPAPPQLAAQPQAPADGPLSGIGSGINWQALEGQAGVPAWAQRMLSAWGQAVAQRDSSAGQAPVQGAPAGQAPVSGGPKAQPSWP